MATAAAAPARTVLDLGDAYWFGPPEPGLSTARDPYLRWASLTNFRSLQRPGSGFPALLSFIVERSDLSLDWNALKHVDRVAVEPVYSEALPDGEVSRFATLRVNTDGLGSVQLTQTLLSLMKHPNIARLQLGYPRGSNRKEPDRGQGPCPPHRTCPLPDPQPAEVVMGIIDDGCPFAHSDLCDDDGHTRVAALWQQSTFDRPDPPWRRPTGVDYGRMLDAAAMNDLILKSRLAGSLDELHCYQAAFSQREKADGRTWDKPNRSLLTRASHGGSVMAVAAGRLPALHGARPKYETGDTLHGAHGDAASQCPLIFVDMPREQVEISSGRWLPVNGLDGLRFILQEARARYQRSDGSKVPVVVNLSSGSTAGAHSGGAMFERAMGELLAADPLLAITLAAGNSRNTESHARLDVPRRGRATVGVFVPPSQPFDTFVEFWLPPKVDASTLEFEVASPDGVVLRVSRAHPEAVLEDGVAGTDTPEQRARKRAAALLFFPEVVQAQDRTMVLLAVCGTVHSLRRDTLAAAGPWRVTVTHRGAARIRIQAWIERDEIVYGTRREQAARFFSFDADERRAAALMRKTNTLSNIASGPLGFAVGAYRGRLADGRMADYSGAPPGSWRAADRYLPFAAKADAGRAHPGVRAAGNRCIVSRRLGGTSVAAPQAARHVANEMAAGRTRADIEAALPTRPAKRPTVGGARRRKIDPRDGRLRL